VDEELHPELVDDPLRYDLCPVGLNVGEGVVPTAAATSSPIARGSKYRSDLEMTPSMSRMPQIQGPAREIAEPIRIEKRTIKTALHWPRRYEAILRVGWTSRWVAWPSAVAEEGRLGLRGAADTDSAAAQ
jgi:hypothetical protein